MESTQTTERHPSRPGGTSHEAGPGEITRRQLLFTAAAAGVVTIVPRHVLGGEGQTPPSAKPNLAGVGVGGVGFGQLQGCEEAGFHMAALCDVDDVYAKKAFDRWPQSRRYRDYREMLQAEGDKIDAVYVGTPDQSHAVISMEALRRKKHVCCVKPLTRTVHECRAVIQQARDAGVCHAGHGLAQHQQSGMPYVRVDLGGGASARCEVHVWSNRPLWPQGMLRPEGRDPVPASLDWDLWTGPAPMRDYKAVWPDGHYALRQIQAYGGKGGGLNAVYHPWNFRGWWDYGTGALGDMGCHHLNTPYRALKLAYPASVHASATTVFPETAPSASIVTYDFPAREDMPPVRIVWYDGGLKPSCPPQMQGRTMPDEGTMYVGDEGIMLDATVLPESRARQMADVPKTLPRRSGTWGEWFEACTGGPPAGCDFPWAGLLTEFVLLGNIALRVGRHLEYDAASARFTNCDEANQYIREPYRDGWTL